MPHGEVDTLAEVLAAAPIQQIALAVDGSEGFVSDTDGSEGILIGLGDKTRHRKSPCF